MKAEDFTQTIALLPAPSTLHTRFLVLGRPARRPALSGW